MVAVGLAATWAMSEHASTGLQAGIAMPVDVLHLLAVAAWLGGLTALLVALYRGPAVERAAVRRFSRVAFGSVVVLALTGLYQSWRQVGSWSALTGTSYGQLLLVKVGLVALLVAVAGLSRRWTGRLGEASGDSGALGSEGEGVSAPGPVEPATGSAPDSGDGERAEVVAATGEASERAEAEGRPAAGRGAEAEAGAPGAESAATARVPPRPTRRGRPSCGGSGRRRRPPPGRSGGTAIRSGRGCVAPCCWRPGSRWSCWRSPRC